MAGNWLSGSSISQNVRPSASWGRGEWNIEHQPGVQDGRYRNGERPKRQRCDGRTKSLLGIRGGPDQVAATHEAALAQLL